MLKINNKLIILSLGILTIIAFGIYSPKTYAYYLYTNNGVVMMEDKVYPTVQYETTYTNNSTPIVNQTNTTSNNTSETSDNTTTTNTTQNTNTTQTSSNTSEENNNVSTNDFNESYGSLTANALLGSNSFMPTGLVQWIVFIIIILLIIFLWRYVHRSEEKYMMEPMKHA